VMSVFNSMKELKKEWIKPPKELMSKEIIYLFTWRVSYYGSYVTIS
jgi:hypothetical protein